MSKQKNRYKRQANKKHILSLAGINSAMFTKDNAKQALMGTGLDIVVGVLGGGLIGAAIGKPSVVAGIVTTAYGHLSHNRLVQILGLGMMAGSSFQKNGAVSGLEGLEGLEGVKERLKAYKEAMSDKFYLDKIMKKKAGATATTNGFGELQYFTYPDVSMNGSLAALDDIEEQIAESARQFQGQLRGDEELMGEDDEVGDLAGHIY